MKRYGLICALAMVLAALMAMPALSQETKETAAEAPAAAAPAAASPAAPAAEQPKDISIYGEVLSVNTAANTMTVQYYDYDSDEEKTVELNLAADTKLENAAGINDVKKGDWVDASYSMAGQKSVAKSVMVEKEEAVSSETSAPAEETAAPVAPVSQ